MAPIETHTSGSTKTQTHPLLFKLSCKFTSQPYKTDTYRNNVTPGLTATIYPVAPI